MNTLDQETLNRIIRKMHIQNEYKKYAELKAAFNNPATTVSAKVDFDKVEFSPEDTYHLCPLLLNNIDCVVREEDYVHILCCNNKLHIIGLKEQTHIILTLGKRLSLWELFCRTCRSYWDYFIPKKSI